jgi:AcrR family transcriptional regulator
MTAQPHDDLAQEPRWRRLPGERPRQILEAALEVFGEHGLAAARLDDIAKRAGVSKGTIYLYFPSKEALFAEMVREKVLSLFESEAGRLRQAETATAQLREYLRALWQYVRSPMFPTVHRLMTAEVHKFPELVRFYVEEVAARSMGLITDILRRGIESGEFRQLDVQAAARMLHALVIMHGQWCAHRELFVLVARLSDDEVLAQITEFYLAAVRAPSAPDAQRV